MTKINRSQRMRYRRSGVAMLCLTAGIATAGLFVAPADAQWWGTNRSTYYHSWNGGYHRAPPVVYGSSYGSTYYGYYGTPYNGTPYYYPPPLVYGPTVVFPGVAIQVR